ncbi:MAG TPA: sulfite exporter TauE/SafE family protein [Mucilaginibacter sp.]|nr:sulfite exporter TauE/SafE family protein [Mucilaginibacter sp.]
MEIIGYLAAALIGISLSLIGGGGSILTVPVMVYLFSVQPSLATSYSLFVVGSASFVGAYTNYRKGLVNVKIALLFGVSSIATVFLTRKFIIPLIPKIIWHDGNHTITESLLVMILFAVVMLLASISMIRNNDQQNEVGIYADTSGLYKLPLYGVAIGLITGLLGIGGGFLIIPVLVLLVGLPIKEAIGTSLFIIALNSFIGFMGDFGHFAIDWLFLFKITLIAIGGIFVGYALNTRIQGRKLKRAFGWMVLVMAGLIITKEIFLKG